MVQHGWHVCNLLHVLHTCCNTTGNYPSSSLQLWIYLQYIQQYTAVESIEASLQQVEQGQLNQLGVCTRSDVGMQWY